MVGKSGLRIQRARPATVVTRHLSGRRVINEGGSVAGLWFECCRAREDHETRLKGFEDIAESF